MDPFNFKDIADLGMNGVLLFMLYKLWERFNTLTDRLFVYLEEAKEDRAALKQQVVDIPLKE